MLTINKYIEEKDSYVTLPDGSRIKRGTVNISRIGNKYSK